MGLLTLFVAALLSRALLAQSSILVARQEEVSTDQDAWDAIEALAASAIVCPLGCAGVLWTVGVSLGNKGYLTVISTTEPPVFQ
ncbi:hypothetical protein Rhopal_005629-T1 [Rhodotorula paludigena]|uniref:Uncharacterized protein n=1 Tax=Rhodotorula paludigena TaxID=86838 RepID=A0AAV5GRM4_9BASI|nr:hypothetical protein Rhopal_005629-T1 [Rhodotorula paludigena]